MRTAREYRPWLHGRLGTYSVLAIAVAACGTNVATPAEVPACEVSLNALAEEAGLDPEGANATDVHSWLERRASRTGAKADMHALRLVEELHFRELGLDPGRWFSPLALTELRCGVAPAPRINRDRCKQDVGALEVALGGCHRLLAPHVPANAMDDLFAECIAQLRAAHEPIAGTDCAAAVGPVVGHVAAAVMTKANTTTLDENARSMGSQQARSSVRLVATAQLIDDDDPRFADIRRRLGIVNNWLALALDLGWSIDDLPSSLSTVWRAAYAVPRPQPTEPQPSPGQVLQFLDLVDQFLIRDGLEDPDYVPLMRVNIEAIALARIAKEIETRADLVHLLCKLGDCNVGIAIRDVAQAIVALADDDISPPSGTALGDRAEAWVDALADAHRQRARFQSALLATPEDAHARLLTTWIDGLRLQLQRLEADPTERLPLATRLHDENRTAIRNAFVAAREELTESLNLFNQAQVQYANSQIAALGQQASEFGLANELVRAVEVLADLEAKAAGLRRLHDDAQLRWATQGDFVTRVERLGLRGEVVLSPSESTSVPLPASARFSAEEGGATADNIPGNSIRSWSVQKGDTLRFTVHNQWSPKCALLTADVHTNQLLEGIDTSYAEVGPEGYYLQYSQSSFSAVSANRTHNEVTAASVCRATAGAAAAVVGGAASTVQGSGSGAQKSGSAELMFGWDSVGAFFSAVGGMIGDCAEGILGGGSSRSSSSTNGEESRYTAAFSGGLRLTNTPFPTLPAGSLVLALVSGSEIVDAYVVHATAAVQMPSTGTAYLLVNDIECAESTGTLLVDWVQGENLGDRAKQLAEAMAQIATEAQPSIDDIANVGLFTSANAENFRVRARQALSESCSNCDIERVFPSAVLGMFEEWITHEIAQMQNRVDLRRLSFEARLQSIAIDSLGGQLALEQAGGRWTEYIKQLAFTELSDVSLKRLENAIESATAFLDERILPILQVRYPEVLSEIHQIPVESVADLDLSIDALASELNDFVVQLDNGLALASTGAKGENTTPVLLWIPKPGGRRTFEEGDEEVRVLVADDEDIANVWQVGPNGRVTLADNARIRVAVQELYSPDAGLADRLACGRTAPIIQGIMLYAVNENSIWRGQPFSDPMNVSRFAVGVVLANPIFVTDDGTQPYDLVAGNAGDLRVARGTFSDRTTVANAFMPVETSLRGLSPFLDIQLQGVGSLNNRLTSASGLALIVNVSSYTADAGISHCD